jgi:hypothetical protein
MKTLIHSILYLLLLNTCFAQSIPEDSLYLGQSLPGYEPKIFVLPVNGSLRPVERITISNDGKEIYFGQLNTYNPGATLKIFYFKYYENKWQGPAELFNGYMAPALSPNDSVLYIQSSINYYTACAYYSVRTGTGWSAPSKLFYFSQQSHYTQKTLLNNYYTSTNFQNPTYRDIGKVIISGTDTSVSNIGLPVNTNIDESDFFIARDESYIIHARHTSSVAGDLFISYKKSSGGWTNSKSLGSHINLPNPTWEYGPFVTQNNKYLFFTRGGNAWASYNTYWVKIDNIIDSLRHTNYIPYLKNQIPNQTDTAGTSYSYTFPDSTFIDDDGNNTLTYSAALSNGSPLPSWLNFNPASRTFWSTSALSGTLSIKVTATDTANASAVCIFPLDVIQQISVEPINEKTINEYRLFQNYPNPFNPGTVISYAVLNYSFVSIKLYDMLGKEIVSLVNSFQKRGLYDIRLNMNDLNLSSGVYFYVLTAIEANTSRIFKDTKVMGFLK